MALKRYSRGLDLLLASCVAFSQGNTDRAGRLFTRAMESEGMDEALETLDEMNEAAARKTPAMAQALAKATSKKVAKADDSGEDDDLGLEEIDLEEGDADDVGDDGDIEDMLKDLDTEESSDDDEDADENKDDETAESMQTPGDGQTGGDKTGESLQQGLPKDTPKAEDEGREAKASAKRLAKTARNMSALSRLAGRRK